MPNVEWSIQEIARFAHTTSRTLRHYGQLGLLEPSRIGSNGYRYYDEDSLIRLQRILLLRDLGLSLNSIAGVLRDQNETVPALHTHLRWLAAEQKRLDRQIRAVENTITAQEKGDALMVKEMFDGFDHVQYKDEVKQRWGAAAFAAGDHWWSSKTAEQKEAHTAEHRQIAADYALARDGGLAPGCAAVQTIVARHLAWLNLSAAHTGGPITPERFTGYGEMYATDERFAANYGGAAGAEFVRDAIREYVE